MRVAPFSDMTRWGVAMTTVTVLGSKKEKSSDGATGQTHAVAGAGNATVARVSASAKAHMAAVTAGRGVAEEGRARAMAARGGWRGAGDGGGEGRTFGTPTLVEQPQQQQRAGKHWKGTRGGLAHARGNGAGAEGRPEGSRHGTALYAPRGGCGTVVESPSTTRGAAGRAGAAGAPAANRRRPTPPRYPLPPLVAAAVRWRGVTAPRGDGRGTVSTRGSANISSIWFESVRY